MAWQHIVLCALQGASQTLTTLKNLVHKGVKVDLGMPYELWDEPSVEVSDMKRQVGLCKGFNTIIFFPVFLIYNDILNKTTRIQ